jgi:hypothetical protein
MPIGIEKTRKSTKATASHRVAVEATADRARHDRVERDVRGHQPEVDDGVERPREEDACKPRVDRVLEAKGHGQDQHKDLDRGADGSPRPEVGARDVPEHGERHRGARVFLAPGAQVDRHQRDPDPRAHHDQHDAEVEEGAADERRDRTCRAPVARPAAIGAEAINVPTIASQNPAQPHFNPTSGRFSASSQIA